MVTIDTVLQVIPAISVSIAAIYYALNIKHQRVTRQAQLFMQIYDRWYDEKFVEIVNTFNSYEFTDYEDFISKYGVEGISKGQIIGRYYEGLGVLVSRKLVDVSLVDDLMSGNIIRDWGRIGPIIIERRIRENWLQYGEWFEYLYNRIKTIIEQQHPELKT